MRPFEVERHSGSAWLAGAADLSPFCDEYGGVVLNCTIDRYAYAFIGPRDDGQVVFQARDVGRQESHPAGSTLDIKEGLRLHRCVYNHFLALGGDRLDGGLTVTTVVDAPPGSGLGSSSGLVVAICEAFRAYINEPLGLYELAHLAYDIERLRLGLAGGQAGSIRGGVRRREFHRIPRWRSCHRQSAADRHPRSSRELETSLVVCFTGTSRESEHIIRQQTSRIEAHDATALGALFDMKQSAIAMKQALLTGDIPAMAHTLMDSWNSKKRTATAVSSTAIDELFEAGLSHGALAGKISGAGRWRLHHVYGRPRGSTRSDRRAQRGQVRKRPPVHLTTKGVESWRAPQAMRSAR